MSEKVIVIGAGGHGKVVADIIKESGDVMLGFLDDNPELSDSFAGFPVLGLVEKYVQYKNEKFVIAIGNAKIRERMAEKLSNIQWYTAIHPSAVISEMGVTLGKGSVVMANAVINAGAAIGKHCIINSGAVVEHDDEIQDFVHVSVGAKLAGTVHIGKRTWIGIGAAVSNNITICEDCMIGAGSVVVRDIEIAGTYAGAPVKRIKSEETG